MSTQIRDTGWMQWLYLALAIAALVGTTAQVSAYLGVGLVQGTVDFWNESVATPASTFLVVDILVLAAVVLIWMFAECRRLGISPAWAWVYYLGSAFVGISIFMPLFFLHRHRRLRAQNPAEASAPAGTDFIAVALLLASIAIAVYYSVTHLPE